MAVIKESNQTIILTLDFRRKFDYGLDVVDIPRLELGTLPLSMESSKPIELYVYILINDL